jgi:hypothetical protein
MWSRCIISAAAVLGAGYAFASTPTEPAQKATATNSTLVQFAQNRGQQQQQRPAPRAAPSNVQRTPMVRPQQPASQRGQMQRGVRPGTQGAPNRSGGGGVTGLGVHGTGGTGATATQSPRSQLYDLVRPAPVPTNLGRPAQAPGNVTRSAPAGTQVPKSAAFAKPTHVPHNSSRKAGTAGHKHNHRPFVFRRAGYVFYRHYYVVSGVWYWYEAEVEPGDPLYALADDPNTPVCEEAEDECIDVD